MSIEAGDIVRTPTIDKVKRTAGQPERAHDTLGVALRDEKGPIQVLPINPEVPHPTSNKGLHGPDLDSLLGWIWHKEDLEVVEKAYDE
jgi:hypothetical protein